jgi:hypothetical protein
MNKKSNTKIPSGSVANNENPVEINRVADNDRRSSGIAI